MASGSERIKEPPGSFLDNNHVKGEALEVRGKTFYDLRLTPYGMKEGITP